MSYSYHMSTKEGVILYIDDDQDDQDIVQRALTDLGISNRLISVPTGNEAIQYLGQNDPPFIILCDYKLAGMDGIELRKRIEADDVMREKSIPFIFFSTTVSQSMTKEVYEMNVQGLFEKGNMYQEIKNTIQLIYNYWQTCRHPNYYNR